MYKLACKTFTAGALVVVTARKALRYALPACRHWKVRVFAVALVHSALDCPTRFFKGESFGVCIRFWIAGSIRIYTFSGA